MEKRKLTNEEKMVIERFEKWVKNLFSCSILNLQNKSPAISFRFHYDKWGAILINNGKVTLTPPENASGKWEAMTRTGTLIASGSSLPQLLLRVLHHEIDQNFIANH